MAQSVSQRKIDRGITALLESDTVTAAAAKAGVSRRTMVRWMGDPYLQRRLQETRRELWNHGTGRLSSLLAKAISTIEAGLDGTKVSKTKYLCAKLTIETYQVIAADDLEARVGELEQRIRDRATCRDMKACRRNNSKIALFASIRNRWKASRPNSSESGFRPCRKRMIRGSLPFWGGSIEGPGPFYV